MASTITVRNVDEVTKRKIQHRAVNHGRSLEAEVRAILRAAANDRDCADVASLSPFMQAAAAFRASVGDIGFAAPPRDNDQPREVLL